MDDARAKGLEQWAAVVGGAPPSIDTDFTAMTVDTVFGGVWSRPQLGHRERRLITLTCIAMGGGFDALPFHARAALDSGDLTVDELEEWIIHLAHYGGWPVAATVYTRTREVVADRG